MLPRSFEIAMALDRALGDPADAANPFSYAACATADADASIPAGACMVLDELGVPQHHVPVEHGGRLPHYEQQVVPPAGIEPTQV
ncbi:hypothetical protein [Pseudonocardia sp. TRM90224]|uniref:hypothetical protein n=1 Tax=Pseudonocardia sp. TRM90224 TaxID=2812678 RepID=UPI001E5A600A|nr:hypothetical protein [Pseudonocardia sp. TRM90224]